MSILSTNQRLSAWESFVNDDIILPEVRPQVAEAWKLCRSLNINPYSEGKAREITYEEFQKCISSNQDLISVSAPAIAQLHEYLPFLDIIGFTDKNGIILELQASPALLKKYKDDVNMTVGAQWTSASIGFSAVDQALSKDTMIYFVGEEHYLKAYHDSVGLAMPIHTVSGYIIGSICANFPVKALTTETELELVKTAMSMLAYAIEQQIDLLRTSEINTRTFEAIQEGIIVTNHTKKPVSINHSALKIFNISEQDAVDMSLDQLIPNFDALASQITEDHHYNGEILFSVRGRVQRCYGSISLLSFRRHNEGYIFTFNTETHFNKSLNKTIGNRSYYCFDDILTNNKKMLSVIENARRISNTNCNVLITGDSGTGKEMLAQSIHSASERCNQPLVIVNCAALPRDLVESELFGYEKGSFTGALSEGKAGKFELADKGTLFLDEIGELPLEIQPKLLRAIETHTVSRIGGKSEKPIDVRLICATNRNLSMEIEKRTFREDLFYRINVINLRIPSLNDRQDDIELLANFFIKKLNKSTASHKKLSKELLNTLPHINWQGNIRQLENAITQAYYLCLPDENIISALPEYLYEARQNTVPLYAESLQDVERDVIIRSLEINRGNVSKTAADLNISRTTIYRKLSQYGISIKDFQK